MLMRNQGWQPVMPNAFLALQLQQYYSLQTSYFYTFYPLEKSRCVDIASPLLKYKFLEGRFLVLIHACVPTVSSKALAGAMLNNHYMTGWHIV